MKQIDALIKRLTLEQKADLCSGLDAWNTYPIPALGIPEVLMTDGPHGLRKQYDASTAVLETSVPATCFPTAATTACSFDRGLLRELGEALGSEAREQGVSMVLGPGINIKRSPLCGRNFEYFSEDPYVSGELGAAMIEGIQSTQTGACLKHFAANNREYFRMVSNSIIDERALREIYLAGFETAVRRAQPYAVMSAYNRLNGEYCGENERLVQTILRDEWGFSGIVVSDWGACYNREKGISAGMDLEMPYSGQENTERIVKAVREGHLAEEALDACVRRLLTFAFRCEENKQTPYACDMEKNHRLARRAAAESAVLLKNDGALPLQEGQGVALIGEFAKKPRYQGAGSSMINPRDLENAVDQFEKYGIPFEYAQGYSLSRDEPDEDLIGDAVRKAARAGTAVVFAGLPAPWEFEGIDRMHLNLPAAQNELIARVSAVAKTVVVLSCGAPVLMPWLPQVNAVLHCYLGGEAAASAAAELLLGLKNPCGKLAETYPLRLEDTPSYNFFTDDRHNIEYRESIYVGYRYYDAAGKDVLFPFGYGLSYTSFDYSDFSLDQTEDGVSVSFTLSNAGPRDGAEIAQVYTRGLSRNYLQLFGFEKVFLRRGESRRVTIALSERAFQFYDHGWKRESSEVLVGRSSRDIVYRKSVVFPDSADAPPYQVSHDGHWDSIKFYDLFEKIPQLLMPHRPFTLNATLADLRAAPTGQMINKAVKKFAGKMIGEGPVADAKRIMLQYLDENPIRALVSLSGGVFTFGMAGAVLMIANGNYVLGIARFAVEYRKSKKRKRKK